jgi:hypothetical protein
LGEQSGYIAILRDATISDKAVLMAEFSLSDGQRVSQ